MRLDLGKRLDSLRPASSPSEIIGSVTKIRELLEGVATHIYLGRPSGAPAAIFNPALATLEHRLDHLDHVKVTRQDVMHAADYLNQAIGFYSDETGREKALKGLLDVAVDHGTAAVGTSSSTGWMASNPTVVGGIKSFLSWYWSSRTLSALPVTLFFKPSSITVK